MKNFFYSFFKTDASRKIFLLLVVAIVIFNFIDAGLSWYFIIHLGAAIELNPFMAALMSFGTGWFFFYKLIVVPALAAVMYHLRYNVIMKICILLSFLMYAGLMFYFFINSLKLLILL